jgi:hypothetical protein
MKLASLSWIGLALPLALAAAEKKPVDTSKIPLPVPRKVDFVKEVYPLFKESCISCHGVADFGATAVFEAPGINLALAFERLQPEYFKRWIRSPLSVDPTTSTASASLAAAMAASARGLGTLSP